MRFWDSSALVPLLVEEPSSRAIGRLLAEDSVIAAWWATPVECMSAIARRERSGAMDPAAASAARTRLTELYGTWTEVPPGERLRDLAVRLVHVHDLRAADALQVAAAIVASEGRPETLELVTLDERLAGAAAREGFRVVTA